MKHSVYLKDQISQLRDVLAMVNSPAWEYFQLDFVELLEATAFESWKKTPAENSLQIIECQQQAKLADAIRAWPKKIEQKLNDHVLQLQAIEDEEAEDQEIVF